MDRARSVPKVVASGKKAGGRKAGTPNKATQNAREAIARFVDGNAHQLEGWLQQIAMNPKQGPKAAFEAFMAVVEYHVPKLARTEVTGGGGGPVQHSVEMTIVDPKG